jgi:tryptophan halogenase
MDATGSGAVRKRIVLVGGGSAGFFTAAAIASSRRLNYDVTVVHSSEVGVIGVGESTTISVPYAFNHVGISSTDLFQKVEPVFKLGIQFTFAPAGAAWNSFYYPFEAAYAPISQLRYDPGYYMLLENEKTCRSFCTYLMDLGKGPVLENDRFRLFGYHFKNDRLIKYLEQLSLARGVNVIEGTVKSFIKDDRGFLKAVVLANGSTIEGDLFIDNTGFSSLLLEGQMEEKWVPQPLLCDRAVTGSWVRPRDQIKPYTLCEAMSAGWMWQIDHLNETNRGYVYSSSFISDVDAEKEFHARTGHRASSTRVIKFRSGYRQRAWVKNVIGIGNSYAFVEPLESTGLHIMCQSAGELVRYLEGHSHDLENEALWDAYSRYVREVWLETFDFITLHYKLCTTYDTPFWQACRDTLQLGGTSLRMMEHYQTIGPSISFSPRISPANMFGAQGYYSILMGLGVPTSCKNPVDADEFQKWKLMQKRVHDAAQRHMSSAEATYRSKFKDLF